MEMICGCQSISGSNTIVIIVKLESYGACLLISLISCGHFASFTSILEPLKFYTLNAMNYINHIMIL